ncbi:unnamed protein product [Anisakis simplex]|uniref:Uncharacterized protein n=1 Tax=Anisakis simplex TaxID=6269 RepID=A0A0M3JHX2_ANISI|nr:unnamed protein product [Anisakis simplex]
MEMTAKSMRTEVVQVEWQQCHEEHPAFRHPQQRLMDRRHPNDRAQMHVFYQCYHRCRQSRTSYTKLKKLLATVNRRVIS